VRLSSDALRVPCGVEDPEVPDQRLQSSPRAGGSDDRVGLDPAAVGEHDVCAVEGVDRRDDLALPFFTPMMPTFDTAIRTWATAGSDCSTCARKDQTASPAYPTPKPAPSR
jgi:hypothetical protein